MFRNQIWNANEPSCSWPIHDETGPSYCTLAEEKDVFDILESACRSKNGKILTPFDISFNEVRCLIVFNNCFIDNEKTASCFFIYTLHYIITLFVSKTLFLLVTFNDIFNERRLFCPWPNVTYHETDHTQKSNRCKRK